jgi:hypothetical protein
MLQNVQLVTSSVMFIPKAASERQPVPIHSLMLAGQREGNPLCGSSFLGSKVPNQQVHPWILVSGQLARTAK